MKNGNSVVTKHGAIRNTEADGTLAYFEAACKYQTSKGTLLQSEPLTCLLKLTLIIIKHSNIVLTLCSKYRTLNQLVRLALWRILPQQWKRLSNLLLWSSNWLFSRPHWAARLGRGSGSANKIPARGCVLRVDGLSARFSRHSPLPRPAAAEAFRAAPIFRSGWALGWKFSKNSGCKFEKNVPRGSR